jgi:cell division septum initiation protein DivIVA
MASKEEVQEALDLLYEKYGNTLQLLADSMDKIDSQAERIAELEEQTNVEPALDVDLTIPQSIIELEKTILGNEQ